MRQTKELNKRAPGQIVIYISVHLVSIYTLTFSNGLLILSLNLIVHKSSYCKRSLAWCQARTFLLQSAGRSHKRSLFSFSASEGDLAFQEAFLRRWKWEIVSNLLFRRSFRHNFYYQCNILGAQTSILMYIWNLIIFIDVQVSKYRKTYWCFYAKFFIEKWLLKIATSH